MTTRRGSRPGLPVCIKRSDFQTNVHYILRSISLRPLPPRLFIDAFSAIKRSPRSLDARLSTPTLKAPWQPTIWARRYTYTDDIRPRKIRTRACRAHYLSLTDSFTPSYTVEILCKLKADSTVVFSAEPFIECFRSKRIQAIVIFIVLTHSRQA